MNKNDEQDGLLESQSTNSSRRVFLKKGAIVTVPVILSAWSRPVLAATVSLSGILSGNASGEGEREGDYGKSPGYWHIPERYAGTGVDPYAQYHTIFPGMYHEINPDTGESLTLMDIFQFYRDNGASDELWSPGAHLISAYMNTIVYAGTYFLSQDDVFQIAIEYANDPTHERSGMIRDFLDTTWD
ncbi:hypothetical protein N9063_00975 [Deltaproteobacteria bacterium]|nr:hypothetical protein [Deltaproteobacteria bacterium]